MQSHIRPSNTTSCTRLFKAFSFNSPSHNHFDRHLRFLHDDGRRRLSAFWAPTGGIAHDADTQEDSHSMLIRGGFVRQSHSGIFHYLPLGLRVQEKIEKLVEKHMAKIGASKVSLSAFSTEDLWGKSGRLNRGSSELFRLQDRKETKFILSPTHEEEITTIVSDIVQSYKELPLRLYQITRKYRDEPRPRQGLLRTREFLMKDLYTFDSTQEKALETYETVRRAYSALFDEFKIPYLVAEADSGDIGGNLSHEYQILSQKGEDHVISCTKCSYVANEEMATGARRSTARETSIKGTINEPSEFPGMVSSVDDLHQNTEASADLHFMGTFPYKRWIGVSKDRGTIFVAIFPADIEDVALPDKPWRKTQPNTYIFKKIFEDLDPSVEDYTKHITGKPAVREFFDYRLPQAFIDGYRLEVSPDFAGFATPRNHGDDIIKSIKPRHEDDTHDLIKIETGDACPNCVDGTLKVQGAIELGHTFHLGTRYSAPLNATFATEANSTKTTRKPPASTGKPKPSTETVPNREEEDTAQTLPATSAHLQMGCHGIGISRIIAAAADSLADAQGLNWPRVIAPFEAIIIAVAGLEPAAVEVYDLLAGTDLLAGARPAAIDAILDDRTTKPLGWKLKDADLIGYPVIVVVGRAWRDQGAHVEVQCRRLGGFREEVGVGELRGVVEGLLERL